MSTCKYVSGRSFHTNSHNARFGQHLRQFTSTGVSNSRPPKWALRAVRAQLQHTSTDARSVRCSEVITIASTGRRQHRSCLYIVCSYQLDVRVDLTNMAPRCLRERPPPPPLPQQHQTPSPSGVKFLPRCSPRCINDAVDTFLICESRPIRSFTFQKLTVQLMREVADGNDSSSQ